jgi:hypothetical protein
LKHVRLPRPVPSLALFAALACAIGFGPNSRAGAQNAPPPPPAPNATTRVATPQPTLVPTAAPTASPSLTPSAEPRGRKGKRVDDSAKPSAAPSPSATPTSPAFATLDGTWEVQLQYIDRTEYSYLTIAQGAAGAITGTWKVNAKTFPFEGTYDGRLIRMLVKEASGNVTMSGYVEGASDMVGNVDLGNGKTEPTAFTAEHRPSSKGSIFRKGV